MVHYISVRKLLKYLPTGQIADLSGLSPSYVSQVKHGKCKPSQKLIDAILQSEHCPKPGHDYLKMFLESRRASGCAANTITYYESQKRRFTETVPHYAAATQRQIERHLASIGPNKYHLGLKGVIETRGVDISAHPQLVLLVSSRQAVRVAHHVS